MARAGCSKPHAASQPLGQSKGHKSYIDRRRGAARSRAQRPRARLAIVQAAPPDLGELLGEYRPEYGTRNGRQCHGHLAADQIIERIDNPVPGAADYFSAFLLQENVPALRIQTVPVSSVRQKVRGYRSVLPVDFTPKLLQVEHQIRVKLGADDIANSRPRDLSSRGREHLEP